MNSLLSGLSAAVLCFVVFYLTAIRKEPSHHGQAILTFVALIFSGVLGIITTAALAIISLI